MIKRVKKALGLVPSPEKWDEMKSEGLCRLLGKEHDMVCHALIPFFVGGSLDLYYYLRKKGFAIATKELIDEFGEGPKNDVFPAYEFCMFSAVDFDFDNAQNIDHPMGKANDLMGKVLNALAIYSYQAKLNPFETMEFPSDFGGGLDGKCLILDIVSVKNKSLEIGNKEYGLMFAMIIPRAEMEYAREHGGAKLISKLKEAKLYPYSDDERPSIV